jgi:hypothetical protein
MQATKYITSHDASQHTGTYMSDVINRTYNQCERTSLNINRRAIIHTGLDIPCNKSNASDLMQHSTSYIITGSCHGQGTSTKIFTPQLLVPPTGIHWHGWHDSTSQSAEDSKIKLTESYPSVSQHVYLETCPILTKAGHYTLENARKLGCRNWRADTQDRGRWRHLLEQAKAHPGLQSRWWWWYDDVTTLYALLFTY